MIRHDPNREVPQLEIEPQHFQPFLDCLRENYPTSSLGTTGLEEDARKYLTLFTDKNFEGLESKRKVEGYDNVAEMVSFSIHIRERAENVSLECHAWPLGSLGSSL